MWMKYFDTKAVNKPRDGTVESVGKTLGNATDEGPDMEVDGNAERAYLQDVTNLVRWKGWWCTKVDLGWYV